MNASYAPGAVLLSILRCPAVFVISFVCTSACPGVGTSGSNDRWETRSASPGPRQQHTAVWTGSEMLIWGGGAAGSFLNTGGRYDPSSDTWQLITTSNAPSGRWKHGAVWTGTEMLAWGGRASFSVAGNKNNGGRYNPATGFWTPITTNGAPSPRSDFAAVWTGSELLVWGGIGEGYAYPVDGGRYNPLTDTWVPISTDSAPQSREMMAAVWTGTEMIIWGGGLQTNATAAPYLSFNDGARYNPATDRWTPLSTNGAPLAATGPAAVWTGREMIVWGGRDWATDREVATAGRYDPVTDSWEPISLLNAPVWRAGHTGVWTGVEMLIWGGGFRTEAGNGLLNSGGRYNPVTDTWADLTLQNAPSSRVNHTAVWTGQALLIFGGYDGHDLNSNHAWIPGTPRIEYDASRDFSLASNPNGVWSYGAAPSLSGPFRLFTIKGMTPDEHGLPVEYWQLLPLREPTVFHNSNAVNVFAVGGQGAFAPGTTWVYSGTDGVSDGFGVIRFTVPADQSGDYRIETWVRPALDGPLAGDTDFHVVRSGAELFGQFLGAHDATGYTNALTLSAGDTVDLMVGRGLDGCGAGSGLKIEAAVTVMPRSAPPTFDLSRDFSLAANPNGAWSYGYLTTLDGPFSLLIYAKNLSSDNGEPISAWQMADDQLPSVARVMGDTTAISADGHFVGPPGTVYFTAGEDDTARNFGVIRFTVPAGRGGGYQLATSVRSLFDGELSADADFHVLRNGQELYAEFLAPNSGTGFTNTVRLEAGDAIDFAIGRGTDGQQEHSGLKIQATINALSTNPADCTTAPSGLVGWWPMNDDLSEVVHGATATASGGPEFTAGAVGRALRFDGVDDQLTVPASAQLDVGTGAGFSIEAWVNPDSVLMQPIMEWSQAPAASGAHFWLGVYGAGSLFANLIDVAGVSHSWRSETDIVQPHVTQHVAMTYDKPAGLLRFYLNGMKVTEHLLGSFTPRTSYPVLIGWRPEQEHFQGWIDELSLYDRALGDQELQAIYAAGAAGKCHHELTGDGIPDSWRQQYFGPDYATDPRAAATADPDGDGANNYREFLDGTNPLDTASVTRAPIWVSTFAGSGAEGGTDGFRTEASFHSLAGLKRDRAGRIWVTEAYLTGFWSVGVGGHRIRIIETDGQIHTFAGSDEPGLVEGPAATARFRGPTEVVFDSQGNAFVTDRLNHRIRQITPEGMVSTFAGSTEGFQDGTGTNAQFYMPIGLAIDPADNLYVADFGNTRIRKITPDAVVTTVAGSVPGDQDGDVSEATFNGPNDVEVAPDGTLYVSDWVNGRVRKISPDGMVSTFAAGLTYNHAVQVDATGNVYAVCGGCYALLKFSPNGTLLWRYEPERGFRDGPAETAQVAFFGDGLLLPDGNYLLNDVLNHRIRLLEPGVRPLLRIEPPGGLFTDTLSVTLRSLAGAGELHYTLDGSEPTASSPLYGGPIPLTESATVTARVLVNGQAVSEIAVATFTRVNSLPPTILAQPQSVTVIAGQPAALAVTATGSAPLSYQWYFQSQPVAGASSNTLVIASVQSADAGPYFVVVSNAGGAVTSQVAILTVEPGRTLALTPPRAQQEGSTIVVPLELVSDGDVGGMTFVLRYNPDYLRNAELVWAPFFDESFTTVNDSVPGEIRAAFAVAGEGVPPGTQQVATVNFLLRSVPHDLDTPLTLEITDVSTPLGDPLVSGNQTRNADIPITRRVYLGDNNANQRLDVGDGTVLLRYLVELDPVRPWDVTGNDLNQNGTLDTGDAIKVLRTAAGLDPQPGGETLGLASVVKASVGPMKSLAAGPESIVLSPETLTGANGATVTVQVRLQDVRTGISGAAFTLDYPTNALRLSSLAALRLGSLVSGNPLAAWNVAPQNSLLAQNGHVSLAVSSANPWPASNGVLAELTFLVQPGATNRYAWPLALRGAELTPDGYSERFPACGTADFIGRSPLPGSLVLPARSPAGLFQFLLNGDPGAAYVVEASTDLVRWTVLTNLFNDSGALPFVDLNSPNFPQRFYRVRVLNR